MVMRRELNADDMHRMCIPRRYWGATFKQISGDGDPSPKSVAKKYITKIEDMIEKGVGLLLWGKNGTGKSCMAVVMAKEFRRRGYPVLFLEVADLKNKVFNREIFDELETFWDRARNVDVLVLDDLGKGIRDEKGAGARVIDELVRHRNAEMLVTIITTNMSPAALKDELKISTMHSLKESVFPIKIEGPDRREDAKREMGKLLAI